MDKKTCIQCYHYIPCVKCSENNVGVCDFGECDLPEHRHMTFDGNCTTCDEYCEYKVADEGRWVVGADLSSIGDFSVGMDYTIDPEGKVVPHSFSITRPEV